MKPSVKETAAFHDLTKEQQDAYLKQHPKSKFGLNYVPIAEKHIDRAIKHGEKVVHHAKMFYKHANEGNMAEAHKHRLKAVNADYDFTTNWRKANDHNTNSDKPLSKDKLDKVRHLNDVSAGYYTRGMKLARKNPIRR